MINREWKWSQAFCKLALRLTPGFLLTEVDTNFLLLQLKGDSRLIFQLTPDFLTGIFTKTFKFSGHRLIEKIERDNTSSKIWELSSLKFLKQGRHLSYLSTICIDVASIEIIGEF